MLFLFQYGFKLLVNKIRRTRLLALNDSLPDFLFYSAIQIYISSGGIRFVTFN
jgi:hypothetical protein